MKDVRQAPAPAPAESIAGPPPASARLRRIQRSSLALLVVGGAVNYIDRSTLAIANPLVRSDLHLSVGEMGLLLSVFLWAYAFAQLPAGWLVDRLGPRRLLAWALAMWSTAQALAGFSTSFLQFLAMRGILGLGESPQFPTSARVVRDWFGPRERGAATGIWNCSGMLGSAISAPLLTFLMISLGWRGMFVLMGIAGLAVAVAWYRIYRDPGTVALTPEEKRYLTQDDIAGSGSSPTFAEWRNLFRSRTTWGMIIGFFGVIYLTWVYSSWLPGYLEIQRHMSIAKTGWVSAIPFVAGTAGSIFGGRLTDHLVQHYRLSPVDSRRYPMAAALVLMALFTVCGALVASDFVAVAAISTAMFFGYIATSSAWAMVSVVAPAQSTASLGAIQNFGGYIGGALAPIVTGLIVQSTGSFVPALLTGAAIGFVCALAYLFIVRNPIIQTGSPAPQAEGGTGHTPRP